MIPKLVHFVWTGGPMSWLNIVTIATFKKFNPTWEIRIHDIPQDIRKHGLMHCTEADWMWWRMLAKHGGFFAGTDIVFLRGVPDKWRDCGMNYCLADDNTGNPRQIAMTGATQGHPYAVAAEKKCGKVVQQDARYDQLMGVPMLSTIPKKLLRSTAGVYKQPMSALCHYDPGSINRLWEGKDLELPTDVIGVHWYGGSKIAKKHEPDALPGHPSYIVRLAESVFP